MLIGIALYLIILPIYPKASYELKTETKKQNDPLKINKKADLNKNKNKQIIAKLPEANYKGEGNRVIIPKINVNAPIVEAETADEGLSKGAWRMPVSAEPGEEGNIIITAHRFKYLPPNNLTFYLLDKMVKGDKILIVWENEEKYYKVENVKIVEDTELSILDKTEKEKLTLFTCHPPFSTEKRLVVTAFPAY